VKYALSLLAGVLAGAAVAATLLYFNPLTRSRAERSANASWALDYSLQGTDTWLSTHDGNFYLPVVPSEAPRLYEKGINGSLLAAMPLRNGNGQVEAFATRITVPSQRTDFMVDGVLVDDYWLISDPARGSVLVHAVNNRWPLLRDSVVRVGWLRQSFAGPGEYDPTVGPGPAGAEIVGLTGAFAGARGHGTEHDRLERFDGSLAPLSGRLSLDVEFAANQ
jgi:hypothetical protein